MSHVEINPLITFIVILVKRSHVEIKWSS